MFTAKEAREKTLALMKKDEEILLTQCDNFIETIVCPNVCSAIEDRQLCCSVDIPENLKLASTIIQQKLIDLGYICTVIYGFSNCLNLCWKE